MKKIMILFLLPFLSWGSVIIKENRDSYALGTMLIRENSLYSGATGENHFWPYIKMSYRYVEWDGLSGVAHFYNGKTFQVGFDVDYLLSGFNETDVGILQGQGKRHNTLMGGIYYLYDLESYFIKLKWQRALYGASEGGRVVVQTGRDFSLFPEGLLTMKVSWMYFNQAYIQYYYGVDDENVTATTPYYQAVGTFNWSFDVRFLWSMAKHWRFFVNMEALRMGSAITQSPLVLRGNIAHWTVGIYYIF